MAVTDPDVFTADASVTFENDVVFMEELSNLVGPQPQQEPPIVNDINNCVQSGTQIIYNVEITCNCGHKNGFKLTFEPNH
uniref:Uncharacterized protein n=1 Tax=Tetranychus urticae TaxID=32264 RepID=T1JQQ8_TETUR